MYLTTFRNSRNYINYNAIDKEKEKILFAKENCDKYSWNNHIIPSKQGNNK